MKDRVSSSELTEPHFVEWGLSEDGEQDDYTSETFLSREQAIVQAEVLPKQYYVWIGEIGVYSTEKGNQIRDWIYYFWTECPRWGLPTGRGTGHPYHAINSLVDYVPYDRREWRGSSTMES